MWIGILIRVWSIIEYINPIYFICHIKLVYDDNFLINLNIFKQPNLKDLNKMAKCLENYRRFQRLRNITIYIYTHTHTSYPHICLYLHIRTNLSIYIYTHTTYMYVLLYKDKSIYISFLCVKNTMDNLLLNIDMMLYSSFLELIQIALLKVYTLWIP